MATRTWMFVGCYTRKMGHASGHGKGISIYDFDTSDGNLRLHSTIPESITGPNPASFHINKVNHMIYAGNEFGDKSSVTGIQFDPQHNFRIIRKFTENSFGNDTCCSSTDVDSKYLYVANYGGNSRSSIATYSIDEMGDLSPLISSGSIEEAGSNGIADRQQRSHMHCAMPCKKGKDPLEFYANDLGRDRLSHYFINKAEGHLNELSFITFEAGMGPRHLWFHPNIPGILYVSLEMGSAIAVIRFNPKTNELLDCAQILTTLPMNVVNDKGSKLTTSHIMCDHEGRWLYCANRGHDSVIRYVIDQKTGLVDTSIAAEWIGSGGKVPRYFNIDPSNQFLVMANQEGAPFDNLSVFRILHQENGKLEFVRSIHSGTPSWIEFVTLPVSTSLQSKL